MKKALALFLTLAMAVSLFAGMAFAEEGVVTVCIGEQPETLDPQLNSASDGSNYIKHLFEGLMRYEWDGSGVGLGVAESYTVSEDNLTWTFTIREDAKWSDGQDLTAEDFVYAFQRLVDPATAAPYAGDMGKFIKNGVAINDGEMELSELGVKAIDAKTLEVTMANYVPFFDQIMAFPSFYPVRKDIVEANGEKWVTSPETLIGNGAYKLESWTSDEEIVMVANDNFYGVDALVAKKIVFKLIKEPNAKLSAVRNGELDYADDMPVEEIEAAKAEGLFFLDPLLGTYYVDFNNQKAPFDNVLVRKAFALALDPEYIAETITRGIYLPASNFVGPGYLEPDGTAFMDKQVVIDRSDYEANKKAAQEALAEAGYPGGEGFPTVEYWTNVTGIHTGTAEAMQNMWKEVLGVNVTIGQMEWSVFLAARRNGEHIIARNGWVGDINDPSDLLQLFVSTSGNNSTHYSNPDYDAIMAQVDACTDPVQRTELMHQAEALAIGQEYAGIPMYYYARYGICNPKLEGVAVYPSGEQLFYLAHIAE